MEPHRLKSVLLELLRRNIAGTEKMI